MRVAAISLLAASFLPLLGGCRGRTSEEPPIAVFRNMYFQPRYNTQASSAYFPDGRAMRAPVEGTVAREMEINPMIGDGRTPDGDAFVETVPNAVVRRAGGMAALLARGRDRYGVYCTPCHDGLGTGKGAVIERAKVPSFNPPTLHSDKVRHMPDGQLFQIISYGNNQMPAYAATVPVDDRWAIVSFVRALQLSQAKVK